MTRTSRHRVPLFESLPRSLCFSIARAVCAILLLAGAQIHAQTNAAPDRPRVSVGDAYYPPFIKLVPQTLPFGMGPIAAIWTPDERFVIAVFSSSESTAPPDMALVVWDFRSGQIVNWIDFEGDRSDALFVKGLSIDEKSTVSIEALLHRPGEAACHGVTLRYRLGKTYPWQRTTPAGEKQDCKKPESHAVASPSGKYFTSVGSAGGYKILPVVEQATGNLVAEFPNREAFAIADAALSPDGKTLAVMAARARMTEKYTTPVMLFSLATSELKEVRITGTRDPYDRMYWLDDQRIAMLSNDGTSPILVLDRMTGKPAGPAIEGQCQAGRPDETVTIGLRTIACRDGGAGGDAAPRQVPQRLVARQDIDPDNGRVAFDAVIEFDRQAGLVTLTSETDGQKRRTILHEKVIAAGRLPNSRLYWAATRTAGVRLGEIDGFGWHGDRLTINFFRNFERGYRFIANSPEGYDTNLEPDTELVRWVNTDNGLISFEPQTFMRTMFQPQLAARLISCSRRQTCGDEFKRTSTLINTILPTVAIDRVMPGPSPNTAIVELTIRNGTGLDTYKRPATTGAYNLRLFRNGSLVAQYPRVNAETAPGDLAAWRQQNLVPVGPDGSSKLKLQISVPTRATPQDLKLTAYAFNDDRVKSTTARIDLRQPPARQLRARRAFVVTIGINAYDQPDLTLQFAVNDAQLLSQRLSVIPGYDVRQIVLAGTEANGKSTKITAATIAQVIAILAGKNVAASKAALAQQGFDASQLDAATPDDIVILSYSGHGWADKTGEFYLVPSDATWVTGSEPIRSQLISAAQMAERLRDIDAAEMAMIIDACHSAASVASNSFKPGPMGDPGLGQLAFDKGIRILAATQADDVALEDSTIRQGLLTFALASEGLTADGGLADTDGDGQIMLDEWLRYATQRMPSLAGDLKLRRLTTNQAGQRGWTRIDTRNTPPAQEPALFDFNSSGSGVALRTAIKQ